MTDQPSAVLAPRDDAPTGPPDAGSRGRAWRQRLSLGRYTGVVVALVVVAVYLTITEPVFLTWDNLMNIVKSNSVIFVLAMGATFVVISGGIDLSVGRGDDRCLDDLRACPARGLVARARAARGTRVRARHRSGERRPHRQGAHLLPRRDARRAVDLVELRPGGQRRADRVGLHRDGVRPDQELRQRRRRADPAPADLRRPPRALRRRRAALHGVRAGALRDGLQPGGGPAERHQHLAASSSRSTRSRASRPAWPRSSRWAA